MRRVRSFTILLIFGALFFQALSFSAYAEPTSGDKWAFQMAPYGWLAGQKGELATIPRLPPSDVAQHGLLLGRSWRF